MKCRVHYRWKGQELFKDVAATQADAAAVFRHTTLPGCEILRVETLGQTSPVRGTPGAKPTAGLPRLRPITEQERVEHPQRLATLRAQLAKLTVPQRRR